MLQLSQGHIRVALKGALKKVFPGRTHGWVWVDYHTALRLLPEEPVRARPTTVTVGPRPPNLFRRVPGEHLHRSVHRRMVELLDMARVVGRVRTPPPSFARRMGYSAMLCAEPSRKLDFLDRVRANLIRVHRVVYLALEDSSRSCLVGSALRPHSLASARALCVLHRRLHSLLSPYLGPRSSERLSDS